MLKLTGFTARDFLQGYVTCNTDRISELTCLPFAACSLQGRVVANGWALQLTDAIGLVMHRTITQTFRDYLEPFLRFSKCTLEGGEDFVYVTTSADDTTADFIPDWHLVRDTTKPQQELAGLPDASSHINEQLIERRQVLIEDRTSGHHLPQMLALQEHGAIDFDKGCYLGQEVVARASFRGAVKRGLASFATANATTLEVGSTYENGDGKGAVVMLGEKQGLWVTRL
jgi:folate-binding protein YgfZ